jgi:tetratricopeptide (TPR) repeat protein
LREAAELDAAHKCDEAESLYRPMLAQGSPSASLLNNVGNHYLVCGQPEKARMYFSQLLKINPAHSNANLQLARLAVEGKDGARALEYLGRVKEPDVAIRLLRAEALYWAARRTDADAALDSLAKEASSDPRVAFALGLSCARLGLFSRAEDAFNAVAVRYPDQFEVLLNLGRAAARAGHYDRASRALEVAVKLQPANVDALLELGRVTAAKGDSSRAVYLLAQARQASPGRSDVLLTLARAAEDAGYYGDSALAYDEYLGLQPDDDAARRDRAVIYGLIDTRRAEGLRELEGYVKTHPRDPLAYYGMARLTFNTEPEKALEQLSAAVHVDPKLASVRFSRGWLLHRLGRDAEAVVDLESASRLAPGHPRIEAQLGVVYLALDRPAEAEKTLRRALSAGTGHPEILMNLGRALMALGREEEAGRYLEEFRKLRPQTARAPLHEAGMIELATLLPAERARREMDRLRTDAKTHPGDPELQLNLALLLLAEGRPEEADHEFHALLRLNASGDLCRRAGAALVEAGRYALAREFLERAASLPAARLDLAIAVFFTAGATQALEALGPSPEGELAGDYLLLKARLLDAAGQSAAARQALDQGLRFSVSRPQVAEQAALLLLRSARQQEALDLLARAILASPGVPDLLLLRALALGQSGRRAEAEKALAEIEARWPEWDRPYLAHALLLERADRPTRARRAFQTVLALDPHSLAARCGVARITSAAAPDSRCSCLAQFDELLFPSCPPP